jgi:hypothetical protein
MFGARECAKDKRLTVEEKNGNKREREKASASCQDEYQKG